MDHKHGGVPIVECAFVALFLGAFGLGCSTDGERSWADGADVAARMQLQPDGTYVDAYTGLRFVWVPPGQVRVDSLDEARAERRETDSPERTITLDQGFYMMVTEISIQDWYRLLDMDVGSPHMDVGPRRRILVPESSLSSRRQGALVARIGSTWDVSGAFPMRGPEAIELEALLDITGLSLPTEDEWEYAATLAIGNLTLSEYLSMYASVNMMEQDDFFRLSTESLVSDLDETILRLTERMSHASSTRELNKQPDEWPQVTQSQELILAQATGSRLLPVEEIRPDPLGFKSLLGNCSELTATASPRRDFKFFLTAGRAGDGYNRRPVIDALVAKGGSYLHWHDAIPMRRDDEVWNLDPDDFGVAPPHVGIRLVGRGSRTSR